MAKGQQKTQREIAEIKTALALSPDNLSEAARICGQPESTVRYYKSTLANDPGFARFCEHKREEFEKASDRIIFKMLKALDANAEALLNDPAAVKKADPNKIANALSALLEKQRLLANTPTTIHGGELTVAKKFEDW